MSVFSIAYLRNHTPTPTGDNAPKQTHPASKSVTSVTSSISKTEAPRTRKMTEKGKAYQLGIKQANREALEKISTRPPSEKSRHSRKSSFRSSRSFSSNQISLALVDAAAKAAKLRAKMELFDKEREIRRMQLENEIAIANAEEDAIKRIIDEDKQSIKEENKSMK